MLVQRTLIDSVRIVEMEKEWDLPEMASDGAVVLFSARSVTRNNWNDKYPFAPTARNLPGDNCTPAFHSTPISPVQIAKTKPKNQTGHQ